MGRFAKLNACKNLFFALRVYLVYQADCLRMCIAQPDEIRPRLQ